MSVVTKHWLNLTDALMYESDDLIEFITEYRDLCSEASGIARFSSMDESFKRVSANRVLDERKYLISKIVDILTRGDVDIREIVDKE